MNTSIHTRTAQVTSEPVLAATLVATMPTRESLDLIPAVCEFCGDDEISVHRNRPAGAVATCPDCAKQVAGGQSGKVLRRPAKRVAGSAVQLGQMTDAQLGQAVRSSVERDMARVAMVERARAVRRLWKERMSQGQLLHEEQLARVVLPGLPATDDLPALPDLDAGALGLDETASPATVAPYRTYCKARAGSLPPSLTSDITNRQVVGLHLILTNVTE